MAMSTNSVANATLELMPKQIQDETQWFDAAWSEIGYDHNGSIEAIGRDMYIVLPQKTAGNQGVGVRSEASSRGTAGTDYLPVPGSITYAQCKAKIAAMYGGINLTGMLKSLMKNAPEAQVENLLLDQFEDIKNSLQKEQRNYFWGAGDGAIAKIASFTGTTGACVVTCTADHEFNGVAMLEVGMQVCGYDSRTAGTASDWGTSQTSCVITGVDYVNNTFDFTNAAGAGTPDLTAGDFLFRSSGAVTGTPSTNHAQTSPMGLTGIVDAPYTGTTHRILTTLQNVSGATYSYWRAQLSDGSGTDRAWNDVTIQGLFDSISQRAGIDIQKNAGDFRLIMGYGVRRALASQWADRRFNPEFMTLEGGFGAIKYYPGTTTPVPMLISPVCPANCVFIIHLPSLKFAELEGWHWLSPGEEANEGLVRRAGMDEYENHLGRYFQLVALRRSPFGLERDVAEL